MLEGQIQKALSGFYYVATADEIYQTRARGNFRNRKVTPLVGDFVKFESDNLKEGYILEILPRKNELVRPPIANVDQGIITMSCQEPKFSANLLDRFLVTLEAQKITPLIYLTKVDLLTDKQYEEMKKLQQDYQKIGYTVILPEQENDESALEQLSQNFSNQLSVFMGQSGAGKSTLLNRLDSTLALKTGAISTALGRGKHTTRHVELLQLFNGLVADTPGFSSLDFLEIELAELPKLFPEFVKVSGQCKFRECTHLHEPGCAVKAEVEAENILASRYENYQQFYHEIKQRKPQYHKNKK